MKKNDALHNTVVLESKLKYYLNELKELKTKLYHLN